MRKILLFLIIPGVLCSINVFSQTIIPVTAGPGAISTAYAAAAAGDTLELVTNGGTYTEPTGLIIKKALTVRAAAGLTIKPVWTSDDGGYLIRSKASINIKDIVLDGSKGAMKSIGGIATDSIGYNIKLTNCDFLNFNNDAGTDGHAISDGVYAGQIDSLVITGCLFKNIRKEGIYIAGHIPAIVGSVKYFKVINSTFSNIKSDAIYIRDNDGVDATPGPIYIINHCTFYDCFASYGVLAHHIDGAVIKNCIASSSVNSGTAYYIYGTSSILKNSLYYNLGINLHTAQSQNIINSDPYFVDAANGNFMLYKDSPAVNAGDDGTTIGDPRWGVSSSTLGKLAVLKKPYSMSPATNSVRIVWETPLNTSQSSVVEYGLTKSLGMSITGASGWLIEGEGYMHEVTLTGLDPFTIYYYRAGNGVEFSDTCTTKTAPAPGTNFRLMIGGDSRDNPPVWEEICTSALKDSIDMSIHVGDYVTYSYDRTYGDEFFTPANILNSKRPFIGCIGNHEIEPGPGTTFYDYMSLPLHQDNGENGESYYNMIYGDVNIIVVNSNGNFGLSTNEEFMTGSPQNLWLLNQLAINTSKWVFIIQHTPVISTSMHGQWTADAKAYLMPVYEAYAAEGKHIVVFNGDDHNFEHLYKAGVNHFRPAGGGASLYDTGLNMVDKPWSIYFNMTHNYSTVDVRSNGDTVIVKAHYPDGEIFYDVTLSTSGNQGPGIYIIEPDGKGDTVEDLFKITWADSDPDDDAKINLYYTTDINVEGTLIAGNISENSEQNYYDWDVSALARGTYYVYAIISDGVNPAFKRLSQGPVNVVADAVAPPSVTQLTGTLIEPTKIAFTWKNPTELVNIENNLATFESGFDGFIGEPHGTATGSLESIAGNIGNGLKINYNITAAWDQYAGVKVISGFPSFASTPFLEFWYRGDGSGNSLRIIAKQDNDQNGSSDDWWYIEKENLSSTEWKHAVEDLRNLKALAWHPNGDQNFDLENMASIDFIIPSATASSGHLDIDEVKLTGQVNPAPDFEGVKLLRRTDRYPLNVTDGDLIYQGILETFTDETIIAGQTYYYSIFAFDEVPNYSVTGSSSQWSTLINDTRDQIASSFELYQNYPNPFSSVTKISYNLPLPEKVILKVYNTLGREIAVLINEEQMAGRNEVSFNAASLTGGIYYYKIQAGKFEQTRRMILLK